MKLSSGNKDHGYGNFVTWRIFCMILLCGNASIFVGKSQHLKGNLSPFNNNYIVALSEVGYLSGSYVKRAFIVPYQSHIKNVSVRYIGTYAHSKPAEYPDNDVKNYEGLKLQAKNWEPEVMQVEVKKIEGDFGPVGLIDFSSLQEPGLYSIWVEDKESTPFFIRKDAYLRTAYETFYYSYIQRCGYNIPGWHAACHLDDAIKWEDGTYRNTAGGWHDAGDLRKWVQWTQWGSMGMLWAKKRWGVVWTGYSKDDILDELRWGNTYFHNMQDPVTDLVWNDVGGGRPGVPGGGERSDDHWSDNIQGNSDDRHINTNSRPGTCFQFAWIQSMCYNVFLSSDILYAQKCLKAAERAFMATYNKYPGREASTSTLCYGLLAACDLSLSTGEIMYTSKAQEYFYELVSRQENSWVGDQQIIKGFFYSNRSKTEVYKDYAQPCILPFALLKASEVLDNEYSIRADSVLLQYLDQYILPITKRNPFGLIPWGIKISDPGRKSTPSHEEELFYRPLAGNIQYRYFSNRQGNNSILGMAAALFAASRKYNRPDFRELGLFQLEFAHGCNPIGVSTISDRHLAKIYPHSRYIGVIPGAVTNGIGGTGKDEPYFGLDYKLDFATTEYWTPMQYQYFIALCELHDAYSLDTDIGVGIK